MAHQSTGDVREVIAPAGRNHQLQLLNYKFPLDWLHFIKKLWSKKRFRVRCFIVWNLILEICQLKVRAFPLKTCSQWLNRCQKNVPIFRTASGTRVYSKVKIKLKGFFPPPQKYMQLLCTLKLFSYWQRNIPLIYIGTEITWSHLNSNTRAS